MTEDLYTKPRRFGSEQYYMVDALSHIGLARRTDSTVVADFVSE